MQNECFIPESPKETQEYISEEEMFKFMCPLTFENFEKHEEINLDKVYCLNSPKNKNAQLESESRKNKEALNAVLLIDDYEAVFNKLESNEENQENKPLTCYEYTSEIVQNYEKEDNIPHFVKNVVSENNFFYPIQNENLEVVVKVEETSKKSKLKKKENSSNAKNEKKEKIKTYKKIKEEPKIFIKSGKRGPYKKKKKTIESINTEDKCFPFSSGRSIFSSNLCSLDYSALEDYFNYNEMNNQVELELDIKNKNEEEDEIDMLFINDQMNLNNNISLWKFTTKKYFIASNGKKKRVKKKRKYKPDDIRKKIKARFHKIIKNIINENLKKAGSTQLFDFIPQCFIGNVSKKVNFNTLELTYKEILSCNFSVELNSDSLNKKVDNIKYLKNQKVLKYLEENPEISKRAGFDIVQNMKYKDLLKLYFNSAQFENSINQLKAENESNEYIEEYIYRAKTYLKFYVDFENEQNKKKVLDEKYSL
jgi:hypothetical protein